MIKTVLSKEMKSVDDYTIKNIGVPSLVLMERAALEVYNKIEKEALIASKICILCGVGNNGADGVTLARIFATKGKMVDIIIMGSEEKASEEMRFQLKIARNLKLNFVDPQSCKEGFFDNYEVIVDAIFGIGLSRDVASGYKTVIERANASKAKKFAVDIPSGLCSDTGNIMGAAFKADYTITFGRIKPGLLLLHGKEYSGEVTLADIGFPQAAFDENEYIRNEFESSKDSLNSYMDTYILEKKDLSLIPERSEYSNKGTFGKVLVVAGSDTIYGAAYLAASAAYKTGAGIVKVLTNVANKASLQETLPEVLISAYKGNPFTEDELKVVEEEVKWCTNIVIGPGLGTDSNAITLFNTVMNCALKYNKSVVIDADGLNILTDNTANTIADDDDFLLDKLKEFEKPVIITPHLQEMSRLCFRGVDDLKADLIKTSREFSSIYKTIVVLKDATTVIATKFAVYINPTGNCAMAKAGSGDVLAGIIAGLVARGTDIKDAGAVGAYIHGLAGENASIKHGINSTTARDIIDEIGGIL